MIATKRATWVLVCAAVLMAACNSPWDYGPPVHPDTATDSQSDMDAASDSTDAAADPDADAETDGATDTGDAGDTTDAQDTDAGDADDADSEVPECGNGLEEDGEECDNGTANSDTLPDACRENCMDPWCGDHVKDTGEECDDGNATTLDGCEPTTCQYTCDPGTDCDDGVFCNGADTCDGTGLCNVHPGDPCATGTECADACDEIADNCFDPAGTSCTSNGLFCDGEEVCDDLGACVSPGTTCADLCWEESDLCCVHDSYLGCDTTLTAIHYFDSCDRQGGMYQACPTHGTCVAGSPPECLCTDHWSGIDCSICPSPWGGANCDVCELSWADGWGGSGDDTGSAIAVDASGNVYTTGYFTGTVDFDPGFGTFDLTSAGSNDIFVSKLDASGNLVWAGQMGGTGDDQGFSIAVDASGNVYTTGYCNGTADFDPGAGTMELSLSGGQYGFISKLDTDGDFVWAKAMQIFSVHVALDASANVHTTGEFIGTVDFDPGAGVANLTSASGGDIFISRLDTNGNHVWARSFYGVNIDCGSSISFDSSSNLYTTGYFFGSVDFDPGAGTFSMSSAGGTDIYVLKLDPAGDFVWARRMGGSLGDYGTTVLTDGPGNIYTSGSFNGTADFDPGAVAYNLSSAGATDGYISKLDASGNFVWAIRVGGTGNDYFSSMAIDGSGNLNIAGDFNGTVDFDPGAGTYNLSSQGGSDVFVARYDASGGLVWAKRMGGPSGDRGKSICISVPGNVHFAGDFHGTADFDPAAGIFDLTSAGGYDAFAAKLCL